MWSPTRSPSVGENMSPIGAWMSYQVTDTLRAASTLTVQVAPDELSQPDRDGEEPDGPLAVSCTVSHSSGSPSSQMSPMHSTCCEPWYSQSVPQLMPAGELVTLPWVVDTVSV